jgi:peptidyl-prolyl cis-trans isomerase A (cyclophilin A)
MQKLILLLVSMLLLSCNKSGMQTTNEAAPQQFTATFETTKGKFDIEVTKKLSPKAADRLYNLVKSGYYNNTVFYRVVPNFVAQFGAVDTVKVNRWKSIKVPHEKVLGSNTTGTITFARLGRESRGFDIFINLRDNTTLDTLTFEGVKGYPAFGKVTKGLDVVEKLYSGYGEKTMEDGNLFTNRERLLRTFPMLDKIVGAYITSEE